MAELMYKSTNLQTQQGGVDVQIYKSPDTAGGVDVQIYKPPDTAGGVDVQIYKPSDPAWLS